MDPSYGQYIMNQVHYYYSNETWPNGERKKVKIRTPLELVACGTENFNYSDTQEVKTFGITNLMCIRNKSAYSIQGDYYSNDFRFLEIKVLKCNPSTSKV